MAFWDFLKRVGGVAAGGLGTLLFTTKKGRELAYGKEGKLKNIDIRSQAQKKYIDWVLGPGGIQNQPIYKQGMEGVQKQLAGPTQEFYNAIESPLRRQLEQQLIPGVMERLGPGAGTGAGGLAGSSALNQALAQALENYSTNVASQRAQFMQNQMNMGVQNALAYGQTPYNIGLSAANMQTFQPTMTPAQPGLLQAAAPAAMNYFLGPQASRTGLQMGGYTIG